MSRLAKRNFAAQFPSLVKSKLITWPTNEGEAEAPRGKLDEPVPTPEDSKPTGPKTTPIPPKSSPDLQ